MAGIRHAGGVHTDGTDPSLGYLPELDGLRGIAVLMVLCLHTSPRLFFWGWAGVDLFFVLSGFLITRILLAHRHEPGMLRAFYMRRVLRIWPVYYLSWAAAALLFAFAGSGALPPGHWSALVFLQYTGAYLPGAAQGDHIWYFQHAWSVAVEEQFYLLWPALLLVMRSRLQFALLAVIALWAAWQARSAGLPPYLLLTRIDGLVLGVCVAFYAARPHRPHLPLLIAAATAVGLMLVLPYLWFGATDRSVAFGPREAAVPGFSLLFAAALLCTLRFGGSAGAGWLRMAPLLWLGRISFGLYMYHVPIGYLTLLGVHHGLWGAATGKALMWMAGLAAAHLSYRHFERRILGLKRAFPYRRQSASAAAPAASAAGELAEGGPSSS